MVLERRLGLVIGVSGNIASTKSTLVEQAVSELYKNIFLELLNNYSRIPKEVRAESEPFHQDLLGLTQDDSVYTLAFQVDMLVGSVRLDGRIAKSGGIAFIDRTIDEHRYIFGEVLHQRGRLNGEDWILYDGLYHRLSKQIPPPHLRLWLRADIDTIKDRIKHRGRAEEERHLTDDSLLRQFDEAFKYHLRQVKEPVIEIDTNDIVLGSNGYIDHRFYKREFPKIAERIKELGILNQIGKD